MFNWLKKLRNGPMNEDYLNAYKDELIQVPKFQWIKTDKAGKVSYYKNVIKQGDLILVEFTDGTRVNYDLIGDAVLKIEDDSMLLDVGETMQMGANMPLSGMPISMPQVNIGAPLRNDNPIQALLKKQKTDPTKIEIAIELKLPPVELYKILSTSFDNANEEIVDYIVADLDVPMIRDAVRSAIVNFYS